MRTGKTGIGLGLAVASVLLAGCSSSASGGSGGSLLPGVQKATSPADGASPGDVVGTSLGSSAGSSAGSDASSRSADGPDGPASSDSADAAESPSAPDGSASSASGKTGSDKPVAKLLAPLKLAATGNQFSDTAMPDVPSAWIQATAAEDSYGEGVSVPVALMAMVDVAAQTEDLDSLRKLCWKNCADLAKVLPAKDKSGRTGYERLSELIESAHPAGEGTNEMNAWYFPGFTAPDHGAPTAADKKDLKLLGTTVAGYHGLRTEFELTDDAKGTLAWDGILPAA